MPPDLLEREKSTTETIETERPRCTLDGQFVTPCPTLDKAMEEHHSKRGISLLSLVNFETGKPTRSYAIVKSGEFRKQGVVMNFCPWCGSSLLPEQATS